MTQPRPQPQDCATMADLRQAIDAMDAMLVPLVAERMRFIDRAAELKPAEGIPARVEERVAEVVANVRRQAEAAGMAPDLAETLWRAMIDWAIAHEERLMAEAEGTRG